MTTAAWLTKAERTRIENRLDEGLLLQCPFCDQPVDRTNGEWGHHNPTGVPVFAHFGCLAENENR